MKNYNIKSFMYYVYRFFSLEDDYRVGCLSQCCSLFITFYSLVKGKL